MGIQTSFAGVGEQSPPLVEIEIERALQNRPRRGEEEDGSGEIEKERAAARRPTGRGVLADGEPEVLKRGSESRLKCLHGDIATVRQVAQKKPGRLRVGVHPAKDVFHGIGDLEGRTVLARGLSPDRKFRQCGGRPPEDEAVELFLAAEMVGDRSGVRPRQIADMADRGSAVTVVGEEHRGGLQQARSCVQNHTFVCIKLRIPVQADREAVLPENPRAAVSSTIRLRDHQIASSRTKKTNDCMKLEEGLDSRLVDR